MAAGIAQSQTRRGRVATSILEGIGRRLWGFPPNLMRPIVDQLGAVGSLRWFVLNMPRYERTLRHYGPIRTHLLAVCVSLANGCPYCSYGHALAFELAYFKTFGVPFSMSEDEIVSLHGQDAALICESLTAAMRPTKISGEQAWIGRMLNFNDTSPTDADGRRLAHIKAMFGVLNSCAIAAKTPPDQAHDPLNKDVLLKRRYAAARAAKPTGLD